MDFEIKDLEILDGGSAGTAAGNTENGSRDSAMNTLTSNSLILAELYKENEELQNKLKLNYRRLLLFETENNKLIEEKNKLFFETQNQIEMSRLLQEKNVRLEEQHMQDEKTARQLGEKIASLETINRTQLSEIRRFSKFHEKIQQVVKPFIVDLKKQVMMLKTELESVKATNGNLTATYEEHCRQSELATRQRDGEITALRAEKTSLIRTYEEQIHSFSKEIIDLQMRNESAEKEVARLKKSVEFKNYFENEVIRFKRTHEDDQRQIQELQQKKSAAEARILSLEQSLTENKAELNSCKIRMADAENNLEVTRSQFSKKIDELTAVQDRMSRLEKLNTQLSTAMSSKQN